MFPFHPFYPARFAERDSSYRKCADVVWSNKCSHRTCTSLRLSPKPLFLRHSEKGIFLFAQSRHSTSGSPIDQIIKQQKEAPASVIRPKLSTRNSKNGCFEKRLAKFQFQKIYCGGLAWPKEHKYCNYSKSNFYFCILHVKKFIPRKKRREKRALTQLLYFGQLRRKMWVVIAGVINAARVYFLIKFGKVQIEQWHVRGSNRPLFRPIRVFPFLPECNDNLPLRSSIL